ncbi:RNA-binding S4 domain-containing protein [candidate division KSB1 bacterium]
METGPDEITQRLDTWLKISRLFKTRKAASDACHRRLVKVNDVTSKSSKQVGIGDDITIRLRGKYRLFKVIAISKRSISAKRARELYEETTPQLLSDEEMLLVELSQKTAKRERPKYPGRPTKKDRRKLMKIRREDTPL